MPNEKKGNEEHGVRLSYKFRIYPTPSQCEAIKANIDASRFVYNHYLRARMDAYERTQQEVRRPKPVCDEQGNVQCDQDGKEIWERGNQGPSPQGEEDAQPQDARRQLRGVQPPARLQVGMGEPIVRRGAGGYPHSPGVQPMRS